MLDLFFSLTILGKFFYCLGVLFLFVSPFSPLNPVSVLFFSVLCFLYEQLLGLYERLFDFFTLTK